MLSFVARLTFSVVLATSALAQTYTINTPSNVVVCLPALLTWEGGVSPYFLSILPAGQPSAPALVDLGQQTGTSVTWIANLGVGVSGFLNLRDSTGTLAQSGPFIIQTGGNITCVGQTAVTSAGPAQATTAVVVTSAGAGSVAVGSSSTKAASAASSSAASASASKAAAISQHAPVGFAAMVGAAVLALTA